MAAEVRGAAAGGATTRAVAKRAAGRGSSYQSDFNPLKPLQHGTPSVFGFRRSRAVALAMLFPFLAFVASAPSANPSASTLAHRHAHMPTGPRRAIGLSPFPPPSCAARGFLRGREGGEGGEGWGVRREVGAARRVVTRRPRPLPGSTQPTLSPPLLILTSPAPLPAHGFLGSCRLLCPRRGCGQL